METGETSILGEPISIEPDVVEIDNEIIDAFNRCRCEIHFTLSDLKMSKRQWNRAMYYYLVYGNNLYLRFPKKLRRKK